MARAAVDPLGQPDRTHQGESLLGTTKRTLSASAAENFALGKAAERERDPGEQRAGNEDQMDDGNGKRDGGTANAGRQRHAGSLQAVPGGQYLDVDLRWTRRRPCGSEWDLD
jgi:hypothetical protein